jgi:hypothetical protein
MVRTSDSRQQIKGGSEVVDGCAAAVLVFLSDVLLWLEAAESGEVGVVLLKARRGLSRWWRRAERRLDNGWRSQQQEDDTRSCPRGRRRSKESIFKRKHAISLLTRRIDPMNSDDVAANRENMVQDHVFGVALGERSFLV